MLKSKSTTNKRGRGNIENNSCNCGRIPKDNSHPFVFDKGIDVEGNNFELTPIALVVHPFPESPEQGTFIVRSCSSVAQ
jgi:hypothetical protein